MKCDQSTNRWWWWWWWMDRDSDFRRRIKVVWIGQGGLRLVVHGLQWTMDNRIVTVSLSEQTEGKPSQTRQTPKAATWITWIVDWQGWPEMKHCQQSTVNKSTRNNQPSNSKPQLSQRFRLLGRLFVSRVMSLSDFMTVTLTLLLYSDSISIPFCFN